MSETLGVKVKFTVTKILMLILNFFHALRKVLKKYNVINNENNISVFIRSSSQYSLSLTIFTTKYNDPVTKGTVGRINNYSASIYGILKLT